MTTSVWQMDNGEQVLMLRKGDLYSDVRTLHGEEITVRTERLSNPRVAEDGASCVYKDVVCSYCAKECKNRK